MMNEPAYLPAALVAAGPEGMLRRAESNRLLIPLHGYRILVGASPAGMNPGALNTLKAFCGALFQGGRGGAGLVFSEARSGRE